MESATVQEHRARPPESTGSSLYPAARSMLGKYSLVVVLVVVSTGFAIADPAVFATLANARTIASTNATIALLALAAMLPLAVGQFDISVGFQFGLAQGLCAGLIVNEGLPAGAAIAVVLLAGLLIGTINGLLVARLGLNSFIATLAVGILVLGTTQWYTGDLTINGAMPDWFLKAGRVQLAGIPLPFVYVLVAAAVLWLALEFTTWGRQVHAAGGNAKADQLAGVPVARVTVQAVAGTGLLCAVAGVLSVSILGASSPVVGLGALLPAFAGAFLGATSIRPGRYNALGTVIAVYVVAIGITGLRQHGALNYVEQYFYGLALLVAVSLARLTSNRPA